MTQHAKKLSRKARQMRRETRTKPVARASVREEQKPTKIFRGGQYVDKKDWDKTHEHLPIPKPPARTIPKCIECSEDGVIAIVASGGKPIAYCKKHAKELVKTPTGYEDYCNKGDYCVLPNHGTEYCQERYCKSCLVHNRYKIELSHSPPPTPSENPEGTSKADTLLERVRKL